MTFLSLSSNLQCNTISKLVYKSLKAIHSMFLINYSPIRFLTVRVRPDVNEVWSKDGQLQHTKLLNVRYRTFNIHKICSFHIELDRHKHEPNSSTVVSTIVSRQSVSQMACLTTWKTNSMTALRSVCCGMPCSSVLSCNSNSATHSDSHRDPATCKSHATCHTHT